MKRLLRAGITTLLMTMFAGACGHKTATQPVEETSFTELNWVSTQVLYTDIPGKHDRSLLFIVASWCPHCQALESEALTDSAVIQNLNASLNVCLVDVTDDSLVTFFDSTVTCHDFGYDIYKITGFPTMVVLDRSGQEIARSKGYRDVPHFLDLIQSINDFNP